MEAEGLQMRALLNDVILRTIFSGLGLADLKSCRLVNSKWNAGANISFIDTSVCCIKNNKTENEQVLKEFEKCFKNFVWSFRKFRFEGSFAVDEFKIFLESRGNIQGLNLNGFTLLNCDNSPLESFNIRDLPGIQQLTSFCVDGEGETHLVIPMSHLGAIKILSVQRNATLEMNSMITPIKLKIGGPSAGIKFVGNFNVKEDTVNLHDLFDVSNLTEMEFVSPGTFINLDKLHTAKLKSGIFEEHMMTEGDHHPPIVKTVHIIKIATHEMNFHVPNSTEFLRITTVPPEITCKSSAELMPNMRMIVCSGSVPNELLFACPNLKSLTVMDGKLDVGALPNIADLLLFGNGWEVVGNRDSALPGFRLMVFLFEGRWECVDDLLDRIHPSFFVLFEPLMFLNKTFEEMCSQNIFNKIFAVIQKQVDRGGRFMSTKIRWSGDELVSAEELKPFEKSPFFCLVDKSPSLSPIYFFPR